MASLCVLVFYHEGRPIQFDTWLDNLQLYLLSDSRDSVSLFDHTSGAAPAPPATTDSATCSQWLTRDAAARLAIRNYLRLAECAHFRQHRTAQALYNAVVARYYSPAIAALGRLLLPYLFPELSAFATVEDLVSHLRTSDARYRAAAPPEFLDRNQPPMFITLYFIVTRLPDSLRFVRDHFLSLDPTVLTVDLLEQHLLGAETCVVAVAAARGTPRTPFFEGCSPSPLPPSYASAAVADVLGAEDVGADSASAKLCSSKDKSGRGGGGGSRGGGGGSNAGGGGSGGGGSSGSGGGSGGFGGVGGGSGGGGSSGGSGGSGSGGGRAGAIQRGGSGGGQRQQQQQRRSETPSPSSFTCGKPHTQYRCFSRLDDAWRAEFGDEAERPRWAELLRYGVAIFELDYDVILAAMYALSVSVEGDCYLCVPHDPGIEAAALGASESVLPGTAPAEALHTFKLDSGASRCFFRDSTTLTPLSAPVPIRLAGPSGGPVIARSSTDLPCLAVLSSSLSDLHLPSFSTNLVSTAALQDAMVPTTTPGGSVAPPCSCRLQSHQNLLWNHCLGHPSLPRLRGMHSCLLVSGLPRSLPPLPPSPATPCLPCAEGRQCAAPHSSFPPTTAPLQTLHMDVWGPAHVSGQGRECYFLLVVDDYTRYTMVFPLRSKDTGGEFSSDLLLDFCHGEGILQSFTLPDSPQKNGIAERRIGLVMEVARTSMIHAAAPHFLWPFVVRYAAHHLNLWPHVSLLETSPTLRWTGEVGDASVFRVWGYRPFVRDTSADKLSAHAIPCIFVGFPPDAPGWQFYHPTSCCVFPSQDVTFDESVPFYHLFPYHSPPPPPRSSFLLPGAEPGGGESEGAGSGGAEPGGEEPRGAETAGVEPGGAKPRAGASLPAQLRKWFTQRTRLRSGAARAGDPAAGDTGAGGATGAGPGGARTRERREPASRPASLVRIGRRVPRPRPPPLPGTHAMALRPSSVPLRVPLPAPLESCLPAVPDPESDRARAASPTVSRLLATGVTDPSFESTAASALVAELVDIAAARRLDYATALVAESQSASPPPVGCECALGTDILEDRVKRPPSSPPAFKARYVAGGFSQRQGVDYFQNFSPTSKMTTLCYVMLSFAFTSVCLPSYVPEKRNEPPPSKIEALDGSNYEVWSGRMRSAFKRYKLLKLAMGEEKMPEEGDARDRWIEKSAVLYDLILQSVNNDMFQHIKDLVELDDSGPKAWKLLRDVIQPNTLPMVIVLEKELAALSMRPGDDVKPVLDKIKDTYARMTAAGSNVSQMQQCTKIISVLDNSWDNLIPTLNTQQDQWTPEWLRQQILQEDFRRRHTGGGASNKTAEGYGAAGGSRGRGGGRGRGRGRGFGRGRGRGDYNEGHGSSGGRGSTRMEGACWYCKKAGHPWFKCFSRPEGWAPPGMKPPSGERARGGAVQGSGAQGSGAHCKANPGMFLMVEDVKGSEGDVGSVGKVVMHPLTHWVIDSGCTSDMTPRADLLDEVKPPGKIKFVAAASGALLPVIGVGNAKVMGANGGLVGLGNVLLVEGLSANLLSVRRLQKSKAKVTFGPTSCRAKLGKSLLWDLEEKSSCIKDLWQLPIIPWNGKPPATAAAAATAKTTAGGEETAPTDGALDAVKKVQQSQQPHGEVLAGVDATAAWAKASSGNGDADWETWHERLCHINIPMLQKHKYGPDGELTRYKSRLVAKGFQQTKGKDFDEIFAPVGKGTTLRVMLGMAANRGWKIKQMDITTAFLNGIILEELYMLQPEGLDDGSGRVCRLKKAIYGLKQAPRAWYHKLEETLLAGGFKKRECDHSLFLLQEKEQFLMILVYVDDILLFSESATMIERVEEMLEMQFKCSKMGDVKYYLGMHLERDLDKGVLRLHQRKYCEGLAEKCGLQDGGKPATPLPSGFTVEPCADEEVVGESDRKLFHSMVGALNYAANYAANHTRPDIAFATSRLASVVSRPSHEQLEAAKRLVRYVSATASVGLEYSAVRQRLQRGAADLSKGEMLLTCYTDASFNSVKADGTTIGGYVCLFGGGAVSWRSKKQNEVGLSSCETEYMALHHGVKEVVWLRRLLEEIGVFQKEPTVILCDNESAVKLAKNACLHGVTKHIRPKWHWVRRLLDKEVQLEIVKTHQQTPSLVSNTLWVLLHVASQRDYELHSLDFSTAFLQGSLHEEIWLRLLPGFSGSFPAGTQWSLQRPFLCIDTSLPPFYVLVYIATQGDYEMHSLDFSTPFLQGRLHEEICLRRPLAFTNNFPLGTQWSLRRPVYGLRQAPREWHDTLLSTSVDLGFRPSTANPLQFVRTRSLFFVLVYITRDRATRTITLTLPTPLAVDHRITGPFPDEPFDSSGPLRGACEMPHVLMTCTRPDLAFPLSLLSRFVATGRHPPINWMAVVRVAKYLVITSGMGLVLGGIEPVVLTGHCDSSYANDVQTQGSTQGGIDLHQCYGYAGASLVDLRLLTFLLTDLGARPRSAPTLFADNKAMILMC
ncbi:unnamed protein product [Closterium sp. NIES-53]